MSFNVGRTMLRHILLVLIISIIFDFPNGKSAEKLQGITHLSIDMISSRMASGTTASYLPEKVNMENFNCIYCEIQSADFDFIIEHVIDQHEDLNLKIKVNCNTKNGLRSYSKNFNVTPSTLKKNKKCIIPVGFSQTIKISKIPEASPLRKIQKISNTPSKSSHSNSDGFNVEVMESEEDLSSFFDDMQLLDKDSQTDPCIVIPVEDESQAEHISDIVSKIPDVLDYLHSAGKTEMYQKFTALLADRKLPLSNIAFLLFCDVVEWFSLNSTRDMRYSEDVKQFWHIGLKLFKGYSFRTTRLHRKTMVQFKVDHEHFSSTMCMMNKLREDSSLCDIKLIIGNQTVQAQRCVLAAGSPYFNSLFLGQFTEANMKEINLSKVTNNITALTNVVTFIYTGQIDINIENLAVIIKLSSFFLIESLRKFCCTFMTDNLSLATCLRFHLLSLEHGLFEIETLAGPMLRSRFHDYLIYEDTTLDISTDEMELLVERNVLQHCSNVTIVKFIGLWVTKWLTERHVLISKSIFDDLVLRKDSPDSCPLQLTNKLSVDSLYKTIESSLSVKCKSRDMFLNSYKQVLKKISSEFDMHTVETKSEPSYSGKETAIITVSPSYENLEFNKKNGTDCFAETEITTEGPILHVCAYIPRTRFWYHIKKVYDDRSNFAKLNDINWDMWKFDAFHDELLLLNFEAEEILVNDLKTLEKFENKKLPYCDFLDDEANESGVFDFADYICVAAGQHNSRYLISKVRRFNNIDQEYLLGTHFSGYKLHEDEKTWQKQFQTEIYDAPYDECDVNVCIMYDLYAKISSVSNEMMVVHSGDELNIVFVVDLNQENAIPVTLLTSMISKADMNIGKGTKILEANDAMYIVTDGTAAGNSYNGKANVRYEYSLNSLRLKEIQSTAANLGQLNETYNHTKTDGYGCALFPCLSESSASIGNGLWYMEGNRDNASFLIKVSVDADKNPVIEHHTPPPFPSITAMFASRISRQILENIKPVTRFFGKE